MSESQNRRLLVLHMLNGAGYSLNADDIQPCGDTVINTVFALLANSQNELKYRREVDELRVSAEADLQSMVQTLAKAKANLEVSDRTNKTLTVKIESQDALIKDLTEKASCAKDEASKATSNLNTALVQFKHKAKRKEAEFTVLQERLQKITSEQLNSAKIGMRIINPSAKKLSAPPTKPSKVAKQEKDMYAVVITTFEDREKQLLGEISSLKSSIFSIYSHLRNSANDLDKALPSDPKLVLSSDPHEEARFHLPFALVQSQIERQFEEIVETFKANALNIIDRTKELTPFNEKNLDENDLANTATIRVLQDEIEQYKQIVEEQKRLIEMSLEMQVDANKHSVMTEEQDLLADLEEQKATIQRRSEQLDEERRKFTEAAVRLGRERVAFEKEKGLFEEERRASEAIQILDQMPETPIWLKTKPKITALPQSPVSQKYQPQKQLPKTPTPQIPSASTVRKATPVSKQQRIKTPTDEIRNTPTRSLANTPSIVAHPEKELLTESSTFANTPVVLRIMLDSEKQVPAYFNSPGANNISADTNRMTPSFESSKGKVIKSALKKSPITPLGTSHGQQIGSSGKRRVVIDTKEKENFF
ncbi:hypothetical protein HK100_012061 [Physocladia obscura]|uniref:Afadin and alpha-actinin-binding-domain-containing protein n=1 Tax=Physocladia obscura TaxID=109957 RepID=A0AAD5T0Y1_9FUNG|nr:hypothetical protein HK100_012061 [Physocladia obscura]